MHTIKQSAEHKKILKRLRERWTRTKEYWKDIHHEGGIDMDYVAGNPWPKKERIAREKAGRPCMVMDELNQYTNQPMSDKVDEYSTMDFNPRQFRAFLLVAQYRSFSRAAETLYITPSGLSVLIRELDILGFVSLIGPPVTSA